MTTRFTLSGNQVLGLPVIRQNAGNIQVTGGQHIFPDDWQITFIAEHENPTPNELNPSSRIVGIEVRSADGGLIGTYTGSAQITSPVGDSYAGFDASTFTKDLVDSSQYLPTLSTLGITNGSVDFHDVPLILDRGNNAYDIINLPAPCFGPNVRLFVKNLGWEKIKHVRVGDFVNTDAGYKRVLWIGGTYVEVTEKNRPVVTGSEIYSPQHRIAWRQKWCKAKFLAEVAAGDLWGYLEPMPKQQEYWHILLDSHRAINTFWNMAESLLPTERALSAMNPRARREILQAIRDAGLTPEDYRKEREDFKRKEVTQ